MSKSFLKSSEVLPSVRINKQNFVRNSILQLSSSSVQFKIQNDNVLGMLKT